MARVLFLSTNARTFRATLVGYLYEIAKKHEVVLVEEAIDPETRKFLENKELFPRLKRIIPFQSPLEGDIYRKNKKMYRTLKKTMQEFKPEIVIAPSDVWPAEMYLFRLARKMGATTVAVQSGFKIAGQQDMLEWSNVMKAYRYMPKMLPFALRTAFVKLRKQIAYMVYHIILPLSAKQKPFFGKASFVFWDDSPGKRDAEYAGVFSKRDKDITVADGIPAEKVFIIGHPLEHKIGREFFEKAYFTKEKTPTEEKTITLMWPDEIIGLHQDTKAFISEDELRSNRQEIIHTIARELPDWQIFIKPHPLAGTADKVREFLGEVPDHVTIVDPKEPADVYIEKSQVICGVPLPSTTLFTAQRQHPEKTILSLNLHNEFLGDAYKDLDGIDYIDTKEKFIKVLQAIREGTFQKENSESTSFDFPDASSFIDYIYEKRIS